MQGQRGRGCSGYLGTIFCSCVLLFLRSAPELGSSTQLLLNCLSSIISLPRSMPDCTLVSEP